VIFSARPDGANRIRRAWAPYGKPRFTLHLTHPTTNVLSRPTTRCQPDPDTRPARPPRAASVLLYNASEKIPLRGHAIRNQSPNSIIAVVPPPSPQSYGDRHPGTESQFVAHIDILSFLFNGETTYLAIARFPPLEAAPRPTGPKSSGYIPLLDPIYFLSVPPSNYRSLPCALAVGPDTPARSYVRTNLHSDSRTICTAGRHAFDIVCRLTGNKLDFDFFLLLFFSRYCCLKLWSDKCSP